MKSMCGMKASIGKLASIMIMAGGVLTSCASLPSEVHRASHAHMQPAMTEEMPPAQAKADLDSWMDWLRNTHPDLSYTTDVEALERTLEQVRQELDATNNRREAWVTMAQLNPLFLDAHTGIRLPQDEFDGWVSEGGNPFPGTVVIRDGKAFLEPESVEILAINDVPISAFLTWILPRIRGEDTKLRERIVSLKFPLAFWTYAGGASDYTVQLRGHDGSHDMVKLQPGLAASNGGVLEQPFKLSHQDGTAILRVDTFEIQKLEDFTQFLDGAFAQIASVGSEKLVIDLRQNGGGARDLSNILMNYLTEDTYAAFSKVTARIVPENKRLIPGSNVGDVMTVPFSQAVTPPDKLEHRFSGEVWVVIGPNTYSQAIAFAATAQDEGIAMLAGMPTSGRANQTGQVQMTDLPNTGFKVQAPIYIFTRRSGDSSAGSLQPDLIIPSSQNAPVLEFLTLLKRPAD